VRLSLTPSFIAKAWGNVCKWIILINIYKWPLCVRNMTACFGRHPALSSAYCTAVCRSVQCADDFLDSLLETGNNRFSHQFAFWSSPERATDGSLQSEDWTLNMEICDLINETEDGWDMKDAWFIIAFNLFADIFRKP